MFVPDLAQLDGKSDEDRIIFWFNYWNELYPVPELKPAFETEGYIAGWSAYAAYTTRKTAFNPITMGRFVGFNTARHEHVHQHLALYGYDTTHTLLFALVDNALAYAYETTLGKQKPHNSVRHYDVHEQVGFSHFITTRHFLVLGKRLSRHAGDIKTLIRTAEQYADSLKWNGVVHPCIRIGQAHQIIGQQHGRIQVLEAQLARQVFRLKIAGFTLAIIAAYLTTTIK